MYTNNFYKSFINESINPFVLFNNEGKLVDYNYEAEILFNTVKPKELYDLTLENSPHNFGFEKKYINLTYGKNIYYAILVGYIDDENIGIELYKQVNLEKEVAKIKDQDIEQTNIFSLIEISKATNFDLSKTEFVENYDTSIPEIKVNINNFLLTLNELFKLYADSKIVEITVNVKLGQYEIIEGKRHSIIYIKCKTNKDVMLSEELENQALGTHINIFKQNDHIKMEFPMIL